MEEKFKKKLLGLTYYFVTSSAKYVLLAKAIYELVEQRGLSKEVFFLGCAAAILDATQRLELRTDIHEKINSLERKIDVK